MRCRFVGAVGGVVSLLGSQLAVALLLLTKLPEKSPTLTTKVFVDPGVRWRMITASLPAGALALFMCCVRGAPFISKLWRQHLSGRSSVDLVQVNLTCDGPRTRSEERRVGKE